METYQAEQSQLHEAERELKVLLNERKLHQDAIAAIDQDVKQVGIFLVLQGCCPRAR